jgi:hypothetical protein
VEQGRRRAPCRLGAGWHRDGGGRPSARGHGDSDRWCRDARDASNERTLRRRVLDPGGERPTRTKAAVQRLHGGSDSVRGANGRSPSVSGLKCRTRLAEERWVQAAVGVERR